MKAPVYPPRRARRANGNCLVLLVLLIAAGVYLAGEAWRHFQSREFREEKEQTLAAYDPSLDAARLRLVAEVERADERIGRMKKAEWALDTPEGKSRMQEALRPLEQSRARLARELAVLDARQEELFVATQARRAGLWGLAREEEPAMLEAGRKAGAQAGRLVDDHAAAERAADEMARPAEPDAPDRSAPSAPEPEVSPKDARQPPGGESPGLDNPIGTLHPPSGGPQGSRIAPSAGIDWTGIAKPDHGGEAIPVVVPTRPSRKATTRVDTARHGATGRRTSAPAEKDPPAMPIITMPDGTLLLPPPGDALPRHPQGRPVWRTD